MRKSTVKTACESCGATGLYSGMCEGAGRAVVCLDCGGTGCCVVEFKPFKERKPRTDIKTVIVGRATKSILESNRSKPEVDYKTWWQNTGG